MAKRGSGKAREYTLHNTVQVIRGGADYFDNIQRIAGNASYSLHFQTYIFDEDETGTRVAEALMNAAKRGVYVYLMVDAYASQKISAEFIARIREAGVHFRFFEPFLRSKVYYFGRRMHHKIIVADAHVCMVGGMNVSNRYNDMPGAPAWLDWALLAEGDVAKEIDKVCRTMWDRAVFSKKCMAVNPPSFAPLPGKCPVRVSRNDWVYKRTEITQTYDELFTKAEKNITIMTSYFWPTRGVLRRMEVAARRGVHIRIVLTGNADVPFAKYSERYLYPRLFRSNIEVYEYNLNVLHGKLAIRDNDWVTVGSYNLNNISALASVELNLDVQDEVVAKDLWSAINEIIVNDCKQITSDNFEASRNVVKKLMYYLAYMTIHGLFFLFTFYFSQRSKK